MKKITLLGVMSLFFANVIFAQLSSVQFGVKGGVNLANLKNDANNTADHRTGFHAGVLAHIHLNHSFALQPEVIYSTQGAEYTNNRRDKINYINVPVLGQYMFSNGLRLQTGPQIGFLTHAESVNGNLESDLNDLVKKTDVSWTLGTGFLTRSGLGIDARYNWGLTNISKTNQELKNQVWQIGLFYQIR